MPPGKQYFCDCSQHCKGRRILVHRTTYQRHAPFRQADLDKRLLSCDLAAVGDTTSTLETEPSVHSDLDASGGMLTDVRCKLICPNLNHP